MKFSFYNEKSFFFLWREIWFDFLKFLWFKKFTMKGLLNVTKQTRNINYGNFICFAKNQRGWNKVKHGFCRQFFIITALEWYKKWCIIINNIKTKGTLCSWKKLSDFFMKFFEVHFICLSIKKIFKRLKVGKIMYIFLRCRKGVKNMFTFCDFFQAFLFDVWIRIKKSNLIYVIVSICKSDVAHPHHKKCCNTWLENLGREIQTILICVAKFLKPP
jgi:hypothetical protein